MKAKIILFALSGSILWSCNSNNEKVEDSGKNEIDTTAENMEDMDGMNMMMYSIPSPSDQFRVLAALDGTKNFMSLLPLDSLNKFANNTQKALAFGMYTADLGYLASYKENVKTLSYFAALEKLSKDLGVSSIFNEEMKKAMDMNQKNSDSIFKMADKTYMSSMVKMTENDKGNELSLMLVGGWIESMYLTFKTSKGFAKSPRINNFLASQKLTAENLMGILLDYQDNADVQMHTKKVTALLEILEKMQCENTETEVTAGEGNKKMLSGGTKCTLSEAVYKELEMKTNEIRNQILNLK